MPHERRIGRILGAVAALLAVLVVVFLGLAIYLLGVSRTLPDLRVDAGTLKSPETSIVYAADGSVIAQWHGEQDRTVVSYGDMPIYLRNAAVAIEDRRFWQHHGVDTEAVMRALRVNAASGGVRQGGSTITQQLVKVLFTKGERTLSRKVREVVLAFELENRADKQKVLETYLNTVYFGNGAYGAESAAQRYFGKHAASLDLAESALLAGLIQSPSRYDPSRNPALARERRDVVLSEMRSQGYITDAQAAIARRSPIRLAAPKDTGSVAPYFVEYVKRDLITRLGEDAVYQGGLRVYTTLDPALQRAAEKSARKLSGSKDPEVAIVTVRHSDGSILAMVGGRNFASNQFNLAAQGRRQPGSAFKPFVLVAALEEGIRPTQVFSAMPYSVRVKDGIWRVQNYENGRTAGSLSLQAATNWSVNAVYARLIMQVGPDKVVDVARRLGITTPVNDDPAIALGGLRTGVSPLEMASAYGTIANAGMHVAPSGVVRVTDDKGKTLYRPSRAADRAVSKAVAMQASLMLHDVVEHGTGSAAKVGQWAAGKTGTTQSYRDAWFVGWSGDLSTAVWVGYPGAQVSMTDVHGIKVTGGSFPARIWSSYMKQATSERSAAITPQQPKGEAPVLVRICQVSMKLANSRCPNTVEMYLSPYLVPRETCTLH
jgi:penicillin-binding protein 1A